MNIIEIEPGVLFNLDMLISARWDVVDGERVFRMDFLQYPASMVYVTKDTERAAELERMLVERGRWYGSINR